MKAQIIIDSEHPFQVVLIPETSIEKKLMQEIGGKKFQAHVGHQFTLRRGNFLAQDTAREIALTEIIEGED